jgi:hypothetical protein
MKTKYVIIMLILIILILLISYHLHKKNEYFDTQKYSVIECEKIIHNLQTGDLLFHYADRSAISNPSGFLIRNVLQTAIFTMPYTHVTIIIICNNEPYVFSSDSTKLKMSIKGNKKNGVHLMKFKDYMQKCKYQVTLLYPISINVNPEPLFDVLPNIISLHFKTFNDLINNILTKNKMLLKPTLFCSDLVMFTLHILNIHTPSSSKFVYSVKDILNVAQQYPYISSPMFIV